MCLVAICQICESLVRSKMAYFDRFDLLFQRLPFVKLNVNNVSATMSLLISTQ